MSARADSLRPFVASNRSPWDHAAATHLLRRTGFSPTRDELDRAVEDGVDSTVDRLIDGVRESERARELDTLGEAIARRDDLERLRDWWLLRMRHTARPLHARMAVFWHGHFATSDRKVRNPVLMLQQLRTIEAHALGGFEALLVAMSRDPAMIVWLDGDLNVKGRPNENYAREVFELFSLGVGNYTEADIREAARAFTGWHQRRGAFVFRGRSHDDGEKTIFGQRGRFDGTDVVRLALAQAAASRFLATKLLREFVTPRPPDALIAAFASTLATSRYDVGASLRRLFKSEAMFAPEHRSVRIKSPVELVIGIARSLELRTPAKALSRATTQMGQRLFEPPSVKGWDGHRRWIDSATMLVRLNAGVLATHPAADANGFHPKRLVRRYRLKTSACARHFALAVALGGTACPAAEAQIERIEGSPAEVLAKALRVLLTTPEYQLA